ERAARERARVVRGHEGRLRRSDQELRGELHWPKRHHTLLEARDPGLLAIHPSISFVRPEPTWAASLPRDSRNRRRIGLLGYLNSHAPACGVSGGCWCWIPTC
ncbi:MAG: hypothetical protein ACKO6F_07605, partial [Cyanobium sp.]